MTQVTELVDRYVAVWNEPDAEKRRRGIAALWAEDGAHFTPSLEARGYQALEARVAGAHQKWVKEGGFVFRSAKNVETHHDGVRFNWEMVPAAGGAIAAAGFDFLVLGDDGRIRLDYQFLDRPPSP
jgi:SnoaL-like domain